MRHSGLFILCLGICAAAANASGRGPVGPGGGGGGGTPSSSARANTSGNASAAGHALASGVHANGIAAHSNGRNEHPGAGRPGGEAIAAATEILPERIMVAGRPANVYKLPRPLSEAQRKHLHRAGFYDAAANGQHYLCFERKYVLQGPIRECIPAGMQE